MSFILGLGLSLLVGIGLYLGAGIFSRDVQVLHLIRIGLPVHIISYLNMKLQKQEYYVLFLLFLTWILILFCHIQFVAATQPINSLSFVFDGVNFGASDFAYSAYSLVTTQYILLLFSLVFRLIILIFYFFPNFLVWSGSGCHSKHFSFNFFV